ncbi:Pre-mRNA splicing Prp18-interacting factor-domain-containing protein [Lentinula raphanica]|nr:Pre-mRNA splicing Prp18-interacting factor-domain-containing protein [Lentinula raphanica]
MAKAGKTEKKEDADFGSSDEEDADEDKYADAADAVGQKLDAKTRITVRNLRIREDTAVSQVSHQPGSFKCLLRSKNTFYVPPEEAKFAGENFFRMSGEAPAVQQLQLFAWQAAARGNNVHLNANPTQGELLHQEFKLLFLVISDFKTFYFQMLNILVSTCRLLVLYQTFLSAWEYLVCTGNDANPRWFQEVRPYGLPFLTSWGQETMAVTESILVQVLEMDFRLLGTSPDYIFNMIAFAASYVLGSKFLDLQTLAVNLPGATSAAIFLIRPRGNARC